jgi:hypothetical protein
MGNLIWAEGDGSLVGVERKVMVELRKREQVQ